jgi:hypothetical protein
MAELELKRANNNNNLFIMFAPPDWTPHAPVILHIKAAFYLVPCVEEENGPKKCYLHRAPHPVFSFFFFFISKFGEI